MEPISTCRAAYLVPFIDILRDLGAPIEWELAHAKLPTLVEETPNDSISNVLATEFLERNERREGIDDLGWLWSQRFSSSLFSEQLLAALRPLPTVKSRLDCFIRLSKLEDSDVRVGVVQSNGRTEAYCEFTPPEGLNGIHISEWTQVMVLIEIVRSIMGKTWSPDEIRFMSDFSVCSAAREANVNTRFVRNANHTSILMPSSVLAKQSTGYGSTATPVPSTGMHDSMENYRRLLRPYLRSAAPKIELFAEISGMSSRTLQRRLQQTGVSYSELIETTRFEMATEMLRDPDIKLVDVAMTLGYENQSNFGRSFRRISGISPGRYRREMFQPDHAA